MTKKELIAMCRYYKSEKENPFMGTKAMLWLAEERWYREYSKGMELTDMLIGFCDEYMHAGLINFNETDGVPLALKATIFALYGKYNEGDLKSAAVGFKTMYIAFY